MRAWHGALLAWLVLAGSATAATAPLYVGQLRCQLPGCSRGVTRWDISGGTNRGYTLENTLTGQALPALLVDDTDATRQADFRQACAHYRLVLVTIGQGESYDLHFSCPPPAVGIGIREFYPYWNGRQLLSYDFFPCTTDGWAAQGTGWAWGDGGAGWGFVPGSQPATLEQAAAEVLALHSRCNVLHRRIGPVSGVEAIF